MLSQKAKEEGERENERQKCREAGGEYHYIPRTVSNMLTTN